MTDGCKDCQNQNICKWCDEMEKVQTEVIKIPYDEIKSPIIITIKCRSFIKVHQKQNGFIASVR